MYEDILVTVIMCVHNTPIEYLRESVSSILWQTHHNLELLIVDDCSENDMYDDEVFNDTRISIIKLDENVGPAAARNVALDRARGTYVAVMDSDDISLPMRLGRQVAFMEDNVDVVACGTWFTYYGDKSHAVEREIDDNEYYRACLLFGNAPTILNPSAMLRRSVLQSHGIRYDERLRKGEDYEVWVQLSQVGRCTNIKENLMLYRVHRGQASQILRTKDVSTYDWVVMKGQYEAMGMTFTPEEELLMQHDFRSGEVDSYTYRLVLDRILAANQRSGYFAQDKLVRRVEEQWRQKVYNTSVIELVALMRKLSLDENRKIVCMELQRIVQHCRS